MKNRTIGEKFCGKHMAKKEKRKKSMRFGTRIAISFAGIIVIPVLLIVIMYMYTASYRLEMYGFESGNIENIYNNTIMLSRLTDEDYAALSQTAAFDSALFEDEDYLDGINEKLEESNAFLVVRIDEAITYLGSDVFDDEQLLSILPEYGSDMSDDSDWTAVRTKTQVMIRQVDFSLDDGREGSAFIVIDLNELYPGLKQWLSDVLLIALVVLVVTVLAITLWLYWGLSQPIQKLKMATRNIRDGNLDFTVQEESSIEEINELCVGFEEMRKRLKESQEEKMSIDSENNELIRNISHDLKTPITAIKGYCEGIMDGIADTPEKMDKYIRTIYNKANGMDKLINELTYYSKIDTNRMPYTFTKTDIREYFSDCKEELELELERERVHFIYKDMLNEDALIIADVEQLRRAIQNIINNSVKYMDKPERTIEMRLSDAGDFIQVDIEDNGKGIAKKDQSRVFDRFYRTDASRNSTRGGSGIGLSIVKKIIEDHGGKVWAGGEEGKGTIVSFILRKYQEVPYNE